MRREKKSNPYSSRGLEQFARINSELNAMREKIATKKGVPGEAVRFAYRNQKWVPVVMKNSNSNVIVGHKAAGDSMAPVETVAPVEAVETVALQPVGRKAIQERKFERSEEMELEGIHGAIGVIIVVLYMIYGGTLCAILWACACCWWCVLAVLRKGEDGYFCDNKSRIRMTVDVEWKREKVNMGRRPVSEKMLLDTAHNC